MKRAWYAFWIRIAYWLRLRGAINSFQRWLKDEHKAARAPLPRFNTPGEVEAYVNARFDYREDESRVGGIVLPLDWISDPEVFQARLASKEQKDGDCDDYHFWVATVLAKTPGVTRVYTLSCGYQGGGHTTCVYRYAGRWYLFNYEVVPIDDPNDAPLKVAEWSVSKKEDPPKAEVFWYVFETMDPPWRAVAIGPKEKVPLS